LELIHRMILRPTMHKNHWGFLDQKSKLENKKSIKNSAVSSYYKVMQFLIKNESKFYV